MRADIGRIIGGYRRISTGDNAVAFRKSLMRPLYVKTASAVSEDKNDDAERPAFLYSKKNR
jgi:hypothetical protein